MIPKFGTSMVLPPYVGPSPAHRAETSPYKCNLIEVAREFSTSPERIDILKGLMNYRRDLKSIGVNGGFQWLDGSFVEKIESTQMRPPADIDVVTFSRAILPHGQDKAEWTKNNIKLFSPRETKNKYKCDAYFLDLDKSAEILVDDTRYFFGLFSHQRDTSLWKGMLQVRFDEDETDALNFLQTL